LRAESSISLKEIEISENSSVARRINNEFALPTEIQREEIEISENSSVAKRINNKYALPTEIQRE